MASFDFDPKSGRHHIRFRFAGQPFKRSLQLCGDREATRVCGVVEETIKDLKRGRLAMPEGADAGTFLISGGAVLGKAISPSVSERCHEAEKPPTIGSIFDVYAATLTPGSKGSNTTYTEAIHAKHYKRVLGAERRFDALSVDVLQRYVNERAKQGVVRDTIHKELTTLRVVWGWSLKRKHVACSLAWRMGDLTLSKAHEKPPFQTWDQIVRQIERGGLTKARQEELWESLWLNQSQTVESLAWLQQHARHPFLNPASWVQTGPGGPGLMAGPTGRPDQLRLLRSELTGKSPSLRERAISSTEIDQSAPEPRLSVRLTALICP